MTLALPYFHDGGILVPAVPSVSGDSWTGSASASDPVILPGSGGSGGPTVGCWVYVTIPSGGSVTYRLWEWAAVPGNSLTAPYLALLWNGSNWGFEVRFVYAKSGGGNAQNGIQQLAFTPGGNSPLLAANTWYWVAVSSCATLSGVSTLRLVVTAAGAGSALFDATSTFSPWVIAGGPGDQSVAATLSVGPPNALGFKMARFHSVPHYCAPTNGSPPVLAMPSPASTRLVNGLIAGEHVYNPDPYTGATPLLNDQQGGGGLTLTSVAGDTLALNAAIPS